MASETKTSPKTDLADTKFQILQLSKSQFETLTTKTNNGILVFQFYYPPNFSPEQSPGLMAYIMKPGHKVVADDAFEILTGTGGMSTEPVFGREQILGDLQIEASEMKALIKDATGSPHGNYSSFIFTPQYDSSNKHLRYLITIDRQSLVTASRVANPSPPRSAM